MWLFIYKNTRLLTYKTLQDLVAPGENLYFDINVVLML